MNIHSSKRPVIVRFGVGVVVALSILSVVVFLPDYLLRAETRDIANDPRPVSSSKWLLELPANQEYDVTNMWTTPTPTSKSTATTRKPKFPHGGVCTPSTPVCSHSSPRVVPNRVHYVWFHKSPADLLFFQYLSMVSVIKFQDPAEIWLWHDTLPTGKYWRNITETITSRNISFILKRVKAPKKIFNIRVSWIEHASDFQRLLAVLQYGGVYLDFDVVVLKNLAPLMCHNAVLGQETSAQICNSFIMGSPGAQYFKLWYESYRTYDPKSWGSHNVIMPYKLYVAHPDLIHVEKECLQHPNWQDSERKFLIGPTERFNWSSNYIIHSWNKITHDILRNISPISIQNDNCTLSEIYRYIYYGHISSPVVPS